MSGPDQSIQILPIIGQIEGHVVINDLPTAYL